MHLIQEAVATEAGPPDIQDAIFRLFSILSTWGAPLVTGLLLEISAISPSDREHIFHADVHLDAEDFSRGIVQTDMTEPHNPWHGWSRGRRTELLRLGALGKVFNSSLYSNFRDQRLPQVAVIQTLLIRRQTRRMIGIDPLQSILQSFPRLKLLIFEPWRTFWRSKSWGYDVGKGTSFPPQT